MKKLKVLPCLVSICAMGLSVPMVAQADAFTDALKGGKPNMDVRLRYEAVDNADTGVSAKDEATALTVRVRGGYTTGEWNALSANMEFEHVSALIDEYSPEDTKYDTVADAEVTEVNQLKLMYKGIPGTAAILGRQRVNLDNQRFVGAVGWRQDEQTFDALVLQNTSLANTTLTYGYVNQVNGINATAPVDVAAHLLNANVKNLGPGALTAYLYQMDFDAAATNANNDTRTIGLRYAGSADVGTKLGFAVEYAKQSDIKDGLDLDADYMLIEVGADAGPVNVKIGYEVLGADSSSANSFQTPLATKHIFNGWADKFLTTPEDGLVDIYVTVGGNVAGVKLVGAYHMYSEDDNQASVASGDDLGDEINLMASKAFGDNYEAGIKYASYSAGDTGVDADKFAVWGGFKF